MKRFQIVILTIMLVSLSACTTNSLPSSSTNQEQNEHRTTIQMVGNVFVLFCEIPNVTLT